MPSRLVDRLGRRREGRVGEGADRNNDQVWLCRLCVEDRRAAVRTEVKNMFLSVLLVGDSHVVAEAAENLNLTRGECRLDPEGASGPALAGKAVTHGNHDRIALSFQTKLPTATGASSGSHRHETYRPSPWFFAMQGSVSTISM